MAILTHSTAPAASGTVFTDLRSGAAQGISNLRRYFVRSQTVSALNKLSDRQLSDIGIERADINSVAMQMAQRAAR